MSTVRIPAGSAIVAPERVSPSLTRMEFLHPQDGDVNLSWAKPLFCDVTVHLSERDIKTKTGPTGADGCYLGRDLVRNCEFVYVPSLRRATRKSKVKITTRRMLQRCLDAASASGPR